MPVCAAPKWIKYVVAGNIEENEEGTSGGGGCHTDFWCGIALFVLLDFFIKYKFNISNKK